MTAPENVVLVVDDTPSKRYVLASWLRRGGYQVIEASTGTAALEVFQQGGIDLVVLDVRLPDMTGFEVCERIKGDPVHGTTPVIHVSAAAIHAIDRTHGLERGADAYLVEPIDPDELLATVAAIMRYYQARLQAERLADRLGRLARVSLAMTASTTITGLLHEAVTGAVQIFQAPVAIVSTGTDGTRLMASCAGIDAPALVRPSSVNLPEATVGVRVGRQPAAYWPQQDWATADTLDILTVRTRSDRSALYIATPSTGANAGAPVLTLFGQTLMSAIDVLGLYDEEHEIALTLQHSLLPRAIPPVPGLAFAVRYVPASDRAEIGGDFYEVARIGHQVMIAVGDVGGHSLHAATIMAELRHATRAYLAEGHDPAAVLNRLNTMMRLLIPDEIATMCLLALDVSTGAVVLANAGHPPPLVSSPTGVRLISEHGPLLGMAGGTAVNVDLVLERGDTLVLYTDGLIETRTDELGVGLKRLMDAAGTVEDDLEEFASRLLVDVGPVHPSDDIAMVAVRWLA